MPSATPERVLSLARERGLTIACAESLTGGLLCSTLVAVAGASDVVRGGVVAYQVDVKESVLRVPAALIREHGVVSEEVARAMAAGVREALGADIGVATTGVAGPDSHDGTEPGWVCVAVVAPGSTVTRRLFHPEARDAVRGAAVADALDAVVHALGETVV